MVKNDALPLAFDANKPARIGLLRRDAPGLPDGVSVTDPAATPAPVQWFELPAFYAFHGGRTHASLGVAVCGVWCAP